MKKSTFHYLIACTTAFSMTISLCGCEAGISRSPSEAGLSAGEAGTESQSGKAIQPDESIIMEDVVQEPLSPEEAQGGSRNGLFVNQEAEYGYEVYLALCRRAFGPDFTFAQAIPADPAAVWRAALDQRDLEESTPRYRSLNERIFLKTLKFPPLEKSPDLLRRRLELMVNSYDGLWSVYTKNLSDGKEVIVNDRAMPSASTMKLFVMAAVYQAISDGEMQRTDEVTSLLASMINVSSNESANRLLALLGKNDYAAGIDKVNQYFHDHGYTGRSHEFNGFQNAATVVSPGHFNRITARDCARLLEQVYHREFGPWTVCNEIEKNMLAQQTRYKIPAGVARVSDSVQIGNKTGEMDQVENDVAIVYSPACDYIICVFSSGWTSYDTAVHHIQDLSEEIYRYYNDDNWVSRAVNVPASLISEDLPWDPMFYSDPQEAVKLARGVRALTAWKRPVRPDLSEDTMSGSGKTAKDSTDYVSMYAVGTDAALPEEEETDYLVLSDADEAGILMVNDEVLMDGFLTEPEGPETGNAENPDSEGAQKASAETETETASEVSSGAEKETASEASSGTEKETVSEASSRTEKEPPLPMAEEAVSITAVFEETETEAVETELSETEFPETEIAGTEANASVADLFRILKEKALEKN